jgi:hypothetical protein
MQLKLLSKVLYLTFTVVLLHGMDHSSIESQNEGFIKDNLIKQVSNASLSIIQQLEKQSLTHENKKLAEKTLQWFLQIHTHLQNEIGYNSNADTIESLKKAVACKHNWTKEELKRSLNNRTPKELRSIHHNLQNITQQLSIKNTVGTVEVIL